MTDAGPLGELSAAVRAAVAAVVGGETATAQPTLDRPRRKGLGDYSTNAAMLLAPVMGEPPREVASRLAAELAGLLGEDLERAEVAGPGFLNLVLSDAWHRRALRWVLDAGERFGAAGAERPEQVLIEFVSANPTGPLVAASGRHAAYGDALARILEHHGHSVDREYYFNDAGNQIRLLGASVQARARGDEVPEGGYQGDYVAELAAAIPGAADADVDELARQAVDLLLAQPCFRACRRSRCRGKALAKIERSLRTEPHLVECLAQPFESRLATRTIHVRNLRGASRCEEAHYAALRTAAVSVLARQTSLQANRRAQPRQSRRIFSG